MPDLPRTIGIILSGAVIGYALYLLTRAIDDWLAWSALVIGLVALGAILRPRVMR